VWTAHQQLLIAPGVGCDQGIDFLDGMPQLMVGICRRQLQLCDEPVHLPDINALSDLYQRIFAH
jgi:hypothetical protein